MCLCSQGLAGPYGKTGIPTTLWVVGDGVRPPPPSILVGVRPPLPVFLGALYHHEKLGVSAQEVCEMGRWRLSQPIVNRLLGTDFEVNFFFGASIAEGFFLWAVDPPTRPSHAALRLGVSIQTCRLHTCAHTCAYPPTHTCIHVWVLTRKQNSHHRPFFLFDGAYYLDIFACRKLS